MSACAFTPLRREERINQGFDPGATAIRGDYRGEGVGYPAEPPNHCKEFTDGVEIVVGAGLLKDWADDAGTEWNSLPDGQDSHRAGLRFDSNNISGDLTSLKGQ